MVACYSSLFAVLLRLTLCCWNLRACQRLGKVHLQTIRRNRGIVCVYFGLTAVNCERLEHYFFRYNLNAINDMHETLPIYVSYHAETFTC